MSKTIENANGSWFDQLLNCWPFCIDQDSIHTVAVAWLFKESGRWVFRPRLCGDDSLFYNAVFFLRLSLPFGIFWSVRWAENWRRSFLQASLGWKGNGRLTMGILWLLTLPIAYLWYLWYGWSNWLLLALLGLFAIRLQSDTSAAAGVSGPNLGQSTGFFFGTH